MMTHEIVLSHALKKKKKKQKQEQEQKQKIENKNMLKNQKTINKEKHEYAIIIAIIPGNKCLRIMYRTF